MKRFLHLLLLALLLSLFAASQTATVKRNVNLRSDPSTDNPPIATLKPPTQVDLIQPDATDGYFHVKTADGQAGWIWGKNIAIKSTEAKTSTAASSGHVGPAKLYPDPSLTPGKADTLELADLTKRYTEGCPSGKTSCTYSQAHRNVPKAVHTKVYVEYNIPQNKRNIKYVEVDHFYPLCAGGSNDITNLWSQVADNEWNGKNFGYHEKDKLETWICAEIKAGRLDPKDAFDRLRKDWVKFYLDEALDAEN